MELINITAQAYAERFSSPEDSLLKQVREETMLTHPHAHMLSGHLQGKFLELLSLMIKPERILEIGTFTGYSALSLAKGLAENGELHTIEMRDQDASTAQAYFNSSQAAGKIRLHIGNALEIIPSLPYEWDLVFIDADKVGYPDYYRLVLPKVKKGGIIIADNVLFHGQVLEEELKTKNAKAIHAFNEMVMQDESVENVLLTVRDGLLLIYKK